MMSGLCTALLRARGVTSHLVACEGRLPQFHTAGQFRLGRRIAFRCRTSRTEIGATAGGRLTIGDRVFVNQGASVVAVCSITIGADCRIGDLAAIYDSDHHRVDTMSDVRTAPVELGCNVWLGRSVIVLPGTTIGDHSVVAAGSVVRGDVPDRVLVAGNPARVVRPLDVADGWLRG